MAGASAPSRRSRGPKPRFALAVVLVAAIAGGLYLLIPRSSRPLRTVTIAVEEEACAPGWRAPVPGLYDFKIVNRSRRAATVSLRQAVSGITVATLSGALPGSTGNLSFRLTRSNAYTWSCQLAGLTQMVSAAAQVPGPHVHFVPYTPPVRLSELVPPLTAFRRYVDEVLVGERRQVRALASDTAAGDLASARTAWLTAHLTWLRIGEDDGAYGAFGELGRQIDGTAAGLQGGTASPQFTGFHKIEYDLWARHDMAAANTASIRLETMIDSLTPGLVARDLPEEELNVGEWTLRCHEILEDALRDSLTADDDYGSNSDLASLTADLAATRVMLNLLGALIVERRPGLVKDAEAKLSRIEKEVNATRRGGRWAGIASLSQLARERIDGATDAALETLAPVSELMRVGNT